MSWFRSDESDATEARVPWPEAYMVPLRNGYWAACVRVSDGSLSQIGKTPEYALCKLVEFLAYKFEEGKEEKVG